MTRNDHLYIINYVKELKKEVKYLVIPIKR